MFLSCHFFAFYTGYIILWQVVAKQCWHVDKSMQVTLWLDAVNTTNVYEWEIGLRDVTKRLAPPTGDILQRVRVRHDNIDKSLATRLPSCRTFIVDTLDFQLNPVFEKSKAGKKKKNEKQEFSQSINTSSSLLSATLQTHSRKTINCFPLTEHYIDCDSH